MSKIEPYTPVRVEPYRYYPNTYIEVEYYTYEQKHSQVALVQQGADELASYLRAIKHLERLKHRADKRRAEREKT